MIYLQNRLISDRHCSTEYKKLLYVCGREGYCELLVNFADFLLIYSTCNFAIPGTSIAGMRERHPDSVKHLSLNHDQAHKLVV